MLGGYMGRILRVDLTSQKMSEEGLPREDVLRQFVGCWGLALRLLFNEIPLGINPTDPRNPLIFMTGPLTGTVAPAPNNASIATLNFDTEYTAGRAHSHGVWGPLLKFAGYDGIIIQGASTNPLYLWITDGKAELLDASKFWGVDADEAEDAIKADLGQPNASVATIGPAGENLVAGAMICNDKNHSFSHSGVGAVMGSKKLKAIAVFGTKYKVPIVDEEKHAEAARKWTKASTESKIYKVVGRGGVPRGNYEWIKAVEIGLMAKNGLTTELENWGKGMSSNEITPRPCFRCPIACSYDVKVTSGPKKDYVAKLGGGGENMEGSSAIVGVDEAGSVFYLTDLYDRLGVESSTIGCALGLAFECYERGLLTKEDTGGLELRWGDADAVEKLLRMTVKREGIGNILAMGPKKAAEWIGGDAPNMAIHVKGSGINLHNWGSSLWGFQFGQIVGGGAGHVAVADFAPEPEIGIPEVKYRTHKGKPEELRKTTMKKYWEDCLGVCWFAAFGFEGSFQNAVDAVSAVTGWDLTAKEALTIGERVLNLERVFNVQRGLRPEDDYDPPPRLIAPVPDGSHKGLTFAPHLKGMVMEYYRLNSWDEVTGKPWVPTLERLGIGDFAKLIWT